MALIKDGYWQDTYWASRYWAEDYWPEYGAAAPGGYDSKHYYYREEKKDELSPLAPLMPKHDKETWLQKPPIILDRLEAFLENMKQLDGDIEEFLERKRKIMLQLSKLGIN